MPQEHGQGSKVGREVDYLGSAGRFVQADMCHSCEQQHEEGTCTRAIEAIVDTDEESQREDNQHGLFIGIGFLIRLERLLAKHVAGCQRQDHQHDKLEGISLDQQRQTCAQPRTAQGSYHGGKHPLPMDKATAGIVPSGNQCTQTGTELVGTDGRMRGQTGNQVSRQGDESATAGNGINKARQEHQRTNNQVFNHNYQNLHPSFPQLTHRFSGFRILAILEPTHVIQSEAKNLISET